MVTDPGQVGYLNFLCKTYDGITKLIVATTNRLQTLGPDINVKTDDILRKMESLKGKTARDIERQLDFWPIWSEWMEGINGIGPSIAGHLIVAYYYRFIKICAVCGADVERVDHEFCCPKCEKKLKKTKKEEERTVIYRIELRDFPKISNWWSYLGMHNTEHCPVCKRRVKHMEKDAEGREWFCPISKGQDGKKLGCGRMFDQGEVVYLKPKRRAGVQANWSTPGRQIGFQIGQQFIKKPHDHLYRAVYDKRRKLREKTHPDAKKLHKMNMALNEMTKLFLSHFWQVARTLDGLPLTDPYINEKEPIHKIIPPFYWEEDRDRVV